MSSSSAQKRRYVHDPLLPPPLPRRSVISCYLSATVNHTLPAPQRYYRRLELRVVVLHGFAMQVDMYILF